MLDFTTDAIFQPSIDFADGSLTDGHEALLAALAFDLDETFVEVEVGQFEVAQLTDAQTTAIKRFQNGTIALPLVLAHIYCGDNLVDFFNGEHLGQVKANLGTFQEFGRVILTVVGNDQELEERFYPTKNAGLRAGMDAYVVQSCHKVL